MTNLADYRSDDHAATYCPADDKLRLCVGRVPRPCYDKLRELGFVSTPKQDCDFAAVWTPAREDACFDLISEHDDIGDEDTSPADRAADRAERFAMYRDKRRGEASDFADRYDEGPTVFGNQNQRRAERAAQRHERLKHKGLGQWSKAEYWQQRTAGVISNALHRLDAATRRGRIIELEKLVRGREKSHKEWKERWDKWEAIANTEPSEDLNKQAETLAGYCSMWAKYPHPDNPEHKDILYYLLRGDEKHRPITAHEAAQLYLGGRNPDEHEDRWLDHYKLRLAYEEQMLESEGGRASAVEMEVGGWIGNRQIHGINKSPLTGRITSVKLMAPEPWWRGEGTAPLTLQSFNIERLAADAYRAPTDEEREAFKQKQKEKKKAKAEAKKKAPPAPKLLNPTPECAERLQAIWNETDKSWQFSSEPKTYKKATQKAYSSYGSGDYSPTETKLVGHDGRVHRVNTSGYPNNVPVFKVRTFHNAVVVLTDKPQVKLPWEEMEEIAANQISEEEVIERLEEIHEVLKKAVKDLTHYPEEHREIITRAIQLGYAFDSSMSQKGLTEKGWKALKERQAANV